ELIDCIIDELGSFEGVSDPESREALKACSLASSSLLTTSRKHLFANVRLKESNDAQDLKRSFILTRILEVLVDDSRITLNHIPPLASHIRSLSIILAPMRVYRSKIRHQTKSEPDPLSDLSSILEIMIASSPIVSVSLEFPYNGKARNWKYLDEPLKVLIKSLCRLPSITALQFKLLEGLPTTLITGCPNLKTLSLDSFHYPILGTPSSFPHLESLVLHGSKEFLERLVFLDPSSLPRLRHIEVSLDAWDGLLTAKELGALERAPSLQSIRFKVYCYDTQYTNPGFPVALDFSLLPRLRSFRLDIDYSESSNYNILVSKTFQIFEAMSGRCSLHDINLGWTFPIDHNIFSSNEDWILFDEVVTSSRFPSLTKLSLRFNLVCGVYPDLSLDRLTSGVRRCLPAVSASDSISFTVETFHA
ncbi:hypothetical protein M413DRAFT_444501, partial [Hebeloma cylindrosporum]